MVVDVGVVVNDEVDREVDLGVDQERVVWKKSKAVLMGVQDGLYGSWEGQGSTSVTLKVFGMAQEGAA